VEQVKSHDGNEPHYNLLQPLLIVNCRHQEEVKDQDLEPVFNDRLTVTRIRAHEPAGHDRHRERGVRRVLHVGQEPLVGVNRPDRKRKEHVDAFDV
jgi:hypothetical protein